MNGKIVLYCLICFLVSNQLTLFGRSFSLDTAAVKLEETIELVWNLSNVNPDSALKIADSALKISTHYDLKAEKAELFRVKGVIYFYKVDFVVAFEYFIKSRDLFIEIGDKEGEAAALNNISLIYRQQGFYEKALAMDLHILEMRNAIGDSLRIAQSLNNLAVSYKDMGKSVEALKYYRQAVALSKKINEESSLDLYFNNIGVIFMDNQELDSAFYYLTKALELGKKQNDKQMISNSLSYLGDYFIRKKEYSKAIENLELSLKLAKEIGIVYEIESAAEYLHIAYAATGRFKDAYTMHLLFKQMADSANNIQTMQKITEIESLTKYEKEKEIQQLIQDKKEIENELDLRKEKQLRNTAFLTVFASLLLLYFLYRNYRRKSITNLKLIAQRDEIISQKEEIESQRDKIDQLNQTKDKFFAIIAHDLRNPLSGIYRLSEIMKLNYDYIDTEKLREYVTQIHFSTQKTYELLENLLKWATVQIGVIQITPSEFNLTRIIRESIELLTENAKQKKIEVNFQVCDDCIARADEEMLTTVIRNLLHNSIKFSPYSGRIQFNIEHEPGFWKVSIEDEGIGISKSDQKLLFDLSNGTRSIGESKQKGTGLGLILCKEFVELNGGKIWVESELNQGSTFIFTVVAVPQIEIFQQN